MRGKILYVFISILFIILFVFILYYIKPTEGAGTPDPALENFQRTWLIRTVDLLRQNKIDFYSALYFIRDLLSASAFTQPPQTVNQNQELTLTFNRFNVHSWDYINSREGSDLPDNKDIWALLWNYDKFESTETGCNALGLRIYTDKELWDSGKIKIKDFFTKLESCSTKISEKSSYYIVIRYKPINGNEGVIISSPFRIIPAPQYYIKITNPVSGSGLKLNHTTSILWDSNLPKNAKVEIKLSYIDSEGRRHIYYIDSNALNTGRYDWHAPQIENTKVGTRPFMINFDSLIKSNEVSLIIETEEAGKGGGEPSRIVAEVKNLRFTEMSLAPYVRIISPKGEERLKIGSTATINWEAKNIMWYRYGFGIWLGAQGDWYECKAELTWLPRYKNSFNWKVNIDNLKWQCETLGKGEITKHNLIVWLQNLINRRLLAQISEGLIPKKPNLNDIYWIEIYAIGINKGKYVVVANDRSSPFYIVEPSSTGISTSTQASISVPCIPDKLVPARLGERGEHIKNLQACLIEAGYNLEGGPTGFYGKETREAVKRFYSDYTELETTNGLYIGPKAIAKLKEIIKGNPAPTTTIPIPVPIPATLTPTLVTSTEVSSPPTVSVSNLLENLILYLRLDEVDGKSIHGTFIRDYSSVYNKVRFYAGISGLLGNMRPVWVKGKINEALNFDGIDDYMVVEDKYGKDFFGNGPFTIAAWVRVEGADPNTAPYSPYTAPNPTYIYKPIVCAGNPNRQPAVNFWIQNISTVQLGQPYKSDLRVIFILREEASDKYIDLYSKTSLKPGEWYHVAAVRDGSNMKIFINGKLDNVRTDGPTGFVGNSTHYLYIGKMSYANYFFQGDIDDVRIYNKALSDEEIRRLYELPIVE